MKSYKIIILIVIISIISFLASINWASEINIFGYGMMESLASFIVLTPLIFIIAELLYLSAIFKIIKRKREELNNIVCISAILQLICLIIIDYIFLGIDKLFLSVLILIPVIVLWSVVGLLLAWKYQDKTIE